MHSNSQDIYVSSFRRGTAATIDIIIVAFLRILTAQTVGVLWFNQKILKFLNDFQAKFGTEVISRSTEHIQFLTSHPIFNQTLLFYFIVFIIGALYHALLNSSSWCATIGKRIMNVALVKNEGKHLNFAQALGHYLLSIVPWIFMIYIVFYQAYTGVNIYEAINGSLTNLILGVITAIWINIHIFTKKKITIQDLIVGTTMVEGKLGGKFPKFFSKK